VRIDIPERLGSGWVEIKERRSWADSNRIEGAGLGMRAGVTQKEIELARSEGRMHELMEIDPHGKIATRLAVSITAVAPELIGSHTSPRAWLDSDDLDEDLGDFLFEEIEGYYAARRRTKSGTPGPEQGA
jgi:hypothetical protein